MNRLALPLAFCVLAFLGCGDNKNEPAPEEPDPTPEEPDEPSPVLMDPSLATEEAPSTYRVRFETTEGPFVLEVTRAWSPNGADRFYNLVKARFYDDAAFFRAIEDFMIQFGIHGDPAVNTKWRNATIDDDPTGERSNTQGTISFATSGANSRTTQLFINLVDNAYLDAMGFTPFGQIIEGMEAVFALHTGYGECAPNGSGPSQNRAQREGNAYLKENFPDLDWITTARIVE